MKKTIWVINMTAGKPDSGWGERHYYFSKFWKQSYDVKIISGSYNHLFHNQPTIDKGKRYTIEEIEEGITFCWVKIPKYDGGSIFKLWSMIVFAFKIRTLRANKLLFEIRDLWPLTPMYLKGYSKWHPIVVIMRWVEKFGYRKSDKIVSLLPNAHSYINKISKDESKFHWIPNGIDEELLVNEMLPKEVTDRIPKNKFIVGYTGTMGMANALEYLIEASISMQTSTNVHFVLVGDGYLKEELKRTTKGNSNITFIDKINKNQVQHILSFFDICFVGRNNTPLFDYGVSSNKFFDYMLAKKPIISSSNKIKDPVELSGCGLVVTPESPKAIVAGIEKIYQMTQSERENMGLRGYDYVKKEHNFNHLSKRYMKLFN